MLYTILFFGIMALWLALVGVCAWNDTKRAQERKEALNRG